MREKCREEVTEREERERERKRKRKREKEKERGRGRGSTGIMKVFESVEQMVGDKSDFLKPKANLTKCFMEISAIKIFH